jgi:small redox-active disulfide protein 2
MIIKILGTGCPNCKRTEQAVKTAIEELNIDATVIKVEDIMEIMQYNIMSTPAVVLDEVVKIKGRVPSVQELKDLFQPEYKINL